MKLKEIKSLKNKQLRIRIAKILGFSIKKRVPLTSPTGSPYSLYLNGEIFTELRQWRSAIGTGDSGWDDSPFFGEDGNWREWIDCVPDWTKDLNSCVELNTILNANNKLKKYKKAIERVVKADEGISDPDILFARIVWATARQRCEAFVLAMEE